MQKLPLQGLLRGWKEGTKERAFSLMMEATLYLVVYSPDEAYKGNYIYARKICYRESDSGLC